ncbi:MAG: S-layer homology domain-containing protein [Clostridia bacterium]|nr:S-layer homology domain-containing protein [Clostridia bacterium]
MRKIIKKSIAVFLIIIMVSGTLVCSAAKQEKVYEDYGSYVLLGDSVASGWSDVEHRETRFVRVEGSYGAFLADDLGVEYHPMACIGFRTTEMRYIFEDNFEGDRFLFYSIDKEEMEWRIPLIRQAVSEAGLITLNVGGNDWGSFIGWHVYEEMDKFQNKNEEFMQKAEEYLTNAGTDENTIESLIDLAALCGALPDIIKVLPSALKTGFDNYMTNWNYMIEDIYALNPDVTLVVTGMFDTSVQDQETADKNEATMLKLSVSQAIVDYANQPMIDGAEKYGYIYVDTTGTICEENHPSVEGHRHIADKILEALPDVRFPYTDVSKDYDTYKAIEYLYQNNIMQGVSENEFAPDSLLTNKQLYDIILNICGVADDVSDPDAEANLIGMVSSLFKIVVTTSDVTKIIKALSLTINIVINEGILNLSRSVTRAEAAVIIKDFVDII